LAESAWKVTQRRIARLWGGEASWRGARGSDGVGCPVSLEVKRSARRVPEGRWIEQAWRQARAEGKPPVLVVVGHRDQKPIAVVDHAWLLELARSAAVIAAPAGEVRNGHTDVLSIAYHLRQLADQIRELGWHRRADYLLEAASALDGKEQAA
jgi:hypothetical protein